MRTQHTALWDATKPVLRGKLIIDESELKLKSSEGRI